MSKERKGRIMTHTAKHTPGPIDMPTPCSVCGTRGWLLVRNDTHGLRIERCDECAIITDSQAWDIAGSFLVDLLMRFDEGTNLEKATAAPAMYEALKDLIGDLGDLHGGSIAELQCHWCGRDYEDEEAGGLCPSDDCPGYIARQAIAQAEGRHPRKEETCK